MTKSPPPPSANTSADQNSSFKILKAHACICVSTLHFYGVSRTKELSLLLLLNGLISGNDRTVCSRFISRLLCNYTVSRLAAAVIETSIKHIVFQTVFSQTEASESSNYSTKF